MNFFTTTLIALFAAGALAAPAELEARADCGVILPACNGGNIVGKTDCRCNGQVAPCDLWQCPGTTNNVMACGQEGTGCVWL
ncbi:unnamed protein product [Zymoseptoria tritici ST99CH_1A5]|uniref:Signal peptide-containing protein n=4 Tax=Zymoseptoria tritici TaxID=1047171 RepID=F9XAR8_ZYMTI|nr:signal peptide-containing protein [Zymoseptoria tritici IPO323]SMQ50551.1 unnamed protein product [Zymoseptoria tritici ST99CH_3D7]SMR52308.1 unnamed protein product [Zymoseptoria tritici ST99CH_1E4]SMR53407.1 unnamed protein product [Zymoseptoria tritici ST99CH_3D1]SMY24218.1 unnamed protein product [Zymoseptoria tritici ST99CH_1A5]EGP87048.1 signal peptide-containing protein [Zymoseptoria tritici IPO323]